METEKGQIDNQNILDGIELEISNINEDQVIDRLLFNFEKRLLFENQTSNAEDNIQVSEGNAQVNEPFQKIVEQILNLSQQVDNKWFQSQQQIIQTSAAQSNLKDSSRIQHIIAKIKADLPSTLTFQQFISQTHHKVNNHQHKAQLIKEDDLPLDYKLIDNQPLYGIDFSDQFYHNHEQMAKTLEEYRAIVTYFCEQGIKQQYLKLGVQVTQKLFLIGQDFLTKLAILFKTTYRKLEQSIFDAYKYIIRLEEQDLRILYRLLFNAKQYLTEQQLTIWCNLMKKSFNMPSEVSQKQMTSFYRFLMIQIKDYKQKCDSIENVVISSSNKTVWNLEIEKEMCQLYLTHKRLRVVLEQLNHNHSEINGEQLDMLTERILRSRFQNILLKTLRKVEIQFNKIDLIHNYSVLLKNRENKIILRAPEALPTRLLLVNIYLSSQISLDNIYEVTKSIYSSLETRFITPLNVNILNTTRKNDIKAQMRANLNNNNTSVHAQQQSSASSSVEEIQPTRRKKNKYVIDSDDEDQIEYSKPKRSKYTVKNEPYYPEAENSLHSKGRRQLTIMETYQQRQQKLRNTVPTPPTPKTDLSRKIIPYNLNPIPPKPYNFRNTTTYSVTDQKNRTDSIVNDITRKIRMDLNVKRRRR